MIQILKQGKSYGLNSKAVENFTDWILKPSKLHTVPILISVKNVLQFKSKGVSNSIQLSDSTHYCSLFTPAKHMYLNVIAQTNYTKGIRKCIKLPSKSPVSLYWSGWEKNLLHLFITHSIQNNKTFAPVVSRMHSLCILLLNYWWWYVNLLSQLTNLALDISSSLLGYSNELKVRNESVVIII